MVTFEPISKIIDLVLKLAQNRLEGRRNLFKEYLEPLFNEIKSVDLFYRELFYKAIQSLPYKREDDNWEISSSDNKNVITQEIITECVIKVKKEFTEGKENPESKQIRDILRNDIDVVLKKIKNIQEKRFVVALAFYFLQDYGSIDNNKLIDLEIANIEEKGGLLAFDTPASYAENYINTKKEPIELERIFRSIFKAQGNKFNQVSRTFAELKYDIYRT